MPKVLIVHGISTDGTDNTDRLAAELVSSGLQVLPVKYHPVRWYNARHRADSVARTLMGHYDPGDSAIGHSFGCLVLYRAMEMGARFGRVVFFGAAMERDIRIPVHGCDRLLNVTNPYDRALSAGRMLPWHPFGALGRDGYAGVLDERIREEQSTARAGPHNHTAPYFSAEFLGYWSRRVYEFVA